MDSSTKALGGKPQLIVGVGPHAILDGFLAFGAMTRINDTQITSVTKIENDDAASGVVTDATWEKVNLIAGIDYIPFDDPIKSITLASSTHSLMLFLEPYNPK